jgi:uncharacterized OB-fold protein
MSWTRFEAGGRPTPLIDERSAPYWDFAARHVLAIARCSRCRTLSHPPDIVCPYCRSTDPDFVFEPVSGRGWLRSWTVVRQSFLHGFDVPFVLADVELVEQADLRMIGHLMGGPEVALRPGLAIRAEFEDIAPDLAIPAFALADD